MGLLNELWDAAAGFFRSASADRDHYQRQHPDRATYAPKLTRHHQQWPGAGERPQHQPWPHERWPGDRR